MASRGLESFAVHPRVRDILFVVVSRAAPAFKRNPARFLVSLARKVTLAGGLVLCIALVLAWHRAAALAALAATLALYGFLAFGLNKSSDRTES